MPLDTPLQALLSAQSNALCSWRLQSEPSQCTTSRRSPVIAARAQDLTSCNWCLQGLQAVAGLMQGPGERWWTGPKLQHVEITSACWPYSPQSWCALPAHLLLEAHCQAATREPQLTRELLCAGLSVRCP